MVRRLVVVVAGMCLFAAPLRAQGRVEVGVGLGYTLSEGIRTEERVAFPGFDRAEVNSGASFNLSFGVYTTPQFLIEFIYGRQDSKLTAEGIGGKVDVSELKVDNYHGAFTYNWGEEDAKIRPFATIGFGATNYSFGNNLVTGGGQIPGDTQFSTTWAGGVKFYVAPKVGIKFTARWTPTYIKTDEAGYWCDPFYGCWVVGDPDYSHQFDLSGGIVIRF